MGQSQSDHPNEYLLLCKIIETRKKDKYIKRKPKNIPGNRGQRGKKRQEEGKTRDRRVQKQMVYGEQFRYRAFLLALSPLQHTYASQPSYHSAPLLSPRGRKLADVCSVGYGYVL